MSKPKGALHRQIEIIKILRKDSEVSVSDLALQFGISEREIISDVKVLSLATDFKHPLLKGITNKICFSIKDGIISMTASDEMKKMLELTAMEVEFARATLPVLQKMHPKNEIIKQLSEKLNDNEGIRLITIDAKTFRG